LVWILSTFCEKLWFWHQFSKNSAKWQFLSIFVKNIAVFIKVQSYQSKEIIHKTRNVLNCGSFFTKYRSPHAKCHFLPTRRYASAGNSDRNVSVRLSRAGIVSKRRKLAA